MKFTKMQGAGNDYVYVDCTQNELKNASEVAVAVSDRHFGIGSDGLILIKKSDKADFFMEMYNADGSQGSMCGNGIRCVGKYVYDNGPMAQSLMDTGQVTWLREDGFKFRPTRSNISWMVCDMVEKPAKVAALMAQWLVNGWCRETIFNLKLPMKKRYEEVSHNLAYIQAQLDEHGINAQIQARQLYHDREEVTVHVRRIWAAVGGRRDER